MKPKILSRLDIRTRRDRGGAHVLEYTGRGLSFLDVIYGFDAGVFFAVVPSEIEAPEATQQLAQSCGIVADDHPDMPAFRRAVTHALLTEAMVIASELLSELAEPMVMWAARDLHELQRRHREALHAVNVTVNTIENDLRRAPAQPVTTQMVGERALRQLREIDKVAYVRFASVYRQFDDIEEFEQELARLELAGADPLPGEEPLPGIDTARTYDEIIFTTPPHAVATQGGTGHD